RSRMRVAEELLRKAFDPAAIPERWPAFETFWADREGRRWVRLPDDLKGQIRIDLFDRHGLWLDQIHIAARDWPDDTWQTVSFGRDRIAVRLEDPDGLPLIRVFRIVRAES